LIVVNGNPLENFKVLYPTGIEEIRDGKVSRRAASNGRSRTASRFTRRRWLGNFANLWQKRGRRRNNSKSGVDFSQKKELIYSKIVEAIEKYNLETIEKRKSLMRSPLHIRLFLYLVAESSRLRPNL
jgi:hypothetical protein